jgi:hypothetical protein
MDLQYSRAFLVRMVRFEPPPGLVDARVSICAFDSLMRKL